MKRNKLILSTGILLIILASFSIIATLAMLDSIIETWITIVSLGTGVNILSFLFVYGYSICIFLAQSIIYMIYGVRLVKFSKYSDAVEKCKNMMIVSLILISCSFLFDPFRYFVGLYIAIIVLAICFLVLSSKNTNISVENKTITENSAQSTPAEETTQVTDEKEKSNTDMMVEKVVALKKLKDSGVLSEEEYNRLIEKSLAPSNQSSQAKDKIEKPKTKRTYARKPSTKDGEKENKNIEK